jgi:hypothetical protein
MALVPDSRSHKGLDPEDEHLFSNGMSNVLRQATSDLCWLLNRGYAIRSATELVGNRFSLAARQRLAVARCACSEQAAAVRARGQVREEHLRQWELWIDGFNVLTGLEVALSGGIILVGRDLCCRDVAGIHRQYRKVEETIPALRLIGEWGARRGVGKCRWWLDKPVSNSGRLRSIVLEVAAQEGWDWEADLVYSPDAVLSKTDQIVATSDSVILDRCQRWINLLRLIIAEQVPQARLVDLSVPPGPATGCMLGSIEQE